MADIKNTADGNTKILKPFVKWAGGKRQLLAEIRKYLPPDIDSRSYFEPFAGAGALFFDLKPGIAFINDINAELMLAYNAIKNDVNTLVEKLREYEASYNPEFYYKLRAIDPRTISSDTEIAARFIFLNRTCYNGLYRVNSEGLFNVPIGRQKKIRICEEELLPAISEWFNSAKIFFSNDDFKTAVEQADENSFVYFDPPYHSAQKTGFTAYQAGGFDKNDHARLRDLLIKLTVRGIPCLLSNADTPFVRKLYSDRAFRLNAVQARRAINCDQNNRGRTNELLITNYDPRDFGAVIWI